MLVLTRENGESLHIKTINNEVTEIKITNADGQEFNIVFEAPQERRILQETLIRYASI